MKSNIILSLAIVSASFAACSNDEVVDVNSGKGIAFRTLVDASTREGNQETSASLNAFKVTAIRSTGTEFETDVTKSGDAWNTAGTYYWPEYELKFYAYANGPASGKGTVTINKDSKTISDFTPDGNVTNHKDLLIAYKAGTKETYNAAPVPLNFKHALSQIEVKAKNAKSSSIKVEIIGVKMVNMATKASLTFPETELGANVKLADNAWGSHADQNMPAKAYYSNGTEAVTLDGTLKSVMFGEKNFMVIPQQLTPWNGTKNNPEAEINKQGAYLAVLCRISNLSNAGETLIYPQPTESDNKAGKYAYSAVAINTNWQPGKKYVYNLTFCGDGGGAGKIDPNPENPGGTDDKTDETPGIGGQDILGGPITFTVSVDDWEEVPTDINM
ncbi:fimbrillin family protein [Bacteroides gallinaceum]|uniref:Fimbrillin family protein n=1 Tax=Bacteroides gallinaceum TaxID=1462571 RepID=A0ABT7VI13_9BACE|nr:fimbrillin family protein [Bacteroides gallinaceum]MDM8325942.1 fimbrillin family protein [Bacteroides gallinaceum]